MYKRIIYQILGFTQKTDFIIIRYLLGTGSYFESDAVTMWVMKDISSL